MIVYPLRQEHIESLQHVYWCQSTARVCFCCFWHPKLILENVFNLSYLLWFLQPFSQCTLNSYLRAWKNAAEDTSAITQHISTCSETCVFHLPILACHRIVFIFEHWISLDLESSSGMFNYCTRSGSAVDWSLQACRKDPGRSLMIADLQTYRGRYHPPSKERTGKEHHILFPLEHSNTKQ